MRLIGYVGIVLLLALSGWGSWASAVAHDWRGLFYMIVVVLMLLLFWRELGRSARQLSGQQTGHLHIKPGSGWGDMPISEFVRGPILRTPQGWILVAGSAVQLAFASFAYLAPTWIGLRFESSVTSAILFAAWPLISFVAFVRFSTHRPNMFTSAVMLISSAFPFHTVYG